MSRSNQQAAVELPKIIKDTVNTEIAYEKGKFLGKGGFAKCYEFWRMSDHKLFAGKVVPKTLLQKSHQKVCSHSIFDGKNFLLKYNFRKKWLKKLNFIAI